MRFAGIHTISPVNHEVAQIFAVFMRDSAQGFIQPVKRNGPDNFRVGAEDFSLSFLHVQIPKCFRQSPPTYQLHFHTGPISVGRSVADLRYDCLSAGNKPPD